MDLLRLESASGTFGVMLYDDADPERNPAAPYAYDAAGFGSMSPAMMREVMEMDEEERANEAGLSFVKKASLWVRFREPRNLLEVERLQDRFFAEFAAEEWITSGGTSDIGRVPGDWEAAEAIDRWFDGRKPDEQMLARLKAGGFSVQIFKSDQLPDSWSEVEKEALSWAATRMAALAFALPR